MTINLLTLVNSSETKFLLIGLKQQLVKLSTCSPDKTHSARNLGFIFGEHLTFSDQISALPKFRFSTYSFTSQHPSISWSQNREYHRHLHRVLQAWLLQRTVLWPTKFLTKPSSCSTSRILSLVLSSGPQNPTISTHIFSHKQNRFIRFF